jgi:hypothetical protein
MLESIDMASALPLLVTIVALIATAVPLLHALWSRVSPADRRVRVEKAA